MKKLFHTNSAWLYLILVGLILILGWLAFTGAPDKEPPKTSLWLPLSQPLTIPISKDGAFASNDQGSFPVAVSDDGYYLSYVGHEKLHVVNLKNGLPDDKAGPTDTGENSMQFLPGSHTVLAGGYSFVLLNAENAQVIGQHKEPPPANDDHRLNEGVVSSDGKLALDGRAQLWDLTTAKFMRRFATQPGMLYAPLRFNKNGSQIYTLAEPTNNPRQDVNLVLWDVASGTPVSDWTVPQSAKSGLLFSPDATQLVLLDNQNQRIVVWDVLNHTKLKEFAARSYGQYSAGITTDNRFLVICDQAGVDIWDLKAGKFARKVVNIHPDDGPNMGFSLSPNTKYLAVSGSSEIYVASLEELYNTGQSN